MASSIVSTAGAEGAACAAQQNDVDGERARRGDFAIGGVAAAVLGDDDVDRVLFHECAVVGFAERTACGDISYMGHWQRRIDRIDAADQIKVLWRVDERRELVAAERDKDAARLFANGAHCCGGVACLDPAIAGNGGPRRPPQRHERHAGAACGGRGVVRNDVRIRMGGVDQGVDSLRNEIVGEARCAAKTADADWHGVRNRRRGAAGERQRHVEIAAPGEAFAKEARFRGAAENEDAGHAKP